MTEYEHIYLLRNKETGKYIFTYWASSQKHNAIFSSEKKAQEALKWFSLREEVSKIEIVEL